jgi:aminobenzoyl-glutamate utilization protein B
VNAAVDGAKVVASGWLDAHSGDVSGWHRTIWELAEPAWREYQSAQWYVDTLRRHDFEVEQGSGGMPTAFYATWTHGDGSGPRVLAYAEYDAVPGNCQAAATTRRPREGLSVHAAGHTDPHSALGISTLAGMLATQAAMRQHDIPGTLVYTGEPAEKMQGSKVVHGVKGYYDDLDAIVSFHPFYLLPLCNTVRWDTHCGSYYSRIYTFECVEPETWGRADHDSPIPASHSEARAPGADAALFTMYALTKTTQDSMLPATGGWSLSEAVLTAGQATADNLPHSIAQIQYSWRVPDVPAAEAVLEVLDANAAAAARSSHCRLRTDWVARNRPGLANHSIAEVTWRNLERVGAPTWGAEAVRVGQALQEAVGLDPDDDPFLPETRKTIAPWDAEQSLRRHLPPEQLNWTSDDYVEMTWYAPTSRFYLARPALTPRTGHPGYPAWVMNALGGIAATIDPMIRATAEVIAGTVLDLLRSAETLGRAHEEFLRRREDAGELPALLPADFTAPTDFRWPEYVTTARGRDWWIPTTERGQLP